MTEPVLLVGAGGFIGQAIASQLCLKGISVVALARRPHIDLIDHPKITWVYGDLRDPFLLESLFQFKLGAIIYAAGSHTPNEAALDPATNIEANLIPLLRCLEQAVKSDVKRFVYLSSGGTIYGPTDRPAEESFPTSPVGAYGLAKLMAEKYIMLMTQGTPIVPAILRLSNVYGPGQLSKPGFGFIPLIIKRAVHEQSVPLFNGGHDVRDYIYIDDAVNAIVAAIQDDRNMILNIGSGVGTSGLQVIKFVENALGRKIVTVIQGSRSQDVSSIVLNISQAYKLLNWAPSTSLKVGIGATVEWVLHHARTL